MAKFTRTKARSIGQVKTKSFDNVPYVKEVVDMVELTDDFKELRILPNSAVTAGVQERTGHQARFLLGLGL